MHNDESADSLVTGIKTKWVDIIILNSMLNLPSTYRSYCMAAVNSNLLTDIARLIKYNLDNCNPIVRANAFTVREIVLKKPCDVTSSS